MPESVPPTTRLNYLHYETRHLDTRGPRRGLPWCSRVGLAPACDPPHPTCDPCMTTASGQPQPSTGTPPPSDSTDSRSPAARSERKPLTAGRSLSATSAVEYLRTRPLLRPLLCCFLLKGLPALSKLLLPANCRLSGTLNLQLCVCSVTKVVSNSSVTPGTVARQAPVSMGFPR